MRNYAGTCKGICSQSLVCKFLIQLLPLKSSMFVVHFSNAFWHGNKVFPKDSSQKEFVPLLVIFQLPYSQYRGVKLCFHFCHYQNQNFSFVLHLCCTRVVHVALVSHSCCSCLTRVVLVSFVLHSCHTRIVYVALVSLVSSTCVAKQARSYQHDINCFMEFEYQTVNISKLQQSHLQEFLYLGILYGQQTI